MTGSFGRLDSYHSVAFRQHSRHFCLELKLNTMVNGGSNKGVERRVRIREARFSDQVKGGVAYVYAVEAVDKAGNVSPMSNRVEETAR